MANLQKNISNVQKQAHKRQDWLQNDRIDGLKINRLNSFTARDEMEKTISNFVSLFPIPMNRIQYLLILFLIRNSSVGQPVIKWTFDTNDASFGQSAAADIDGDGKNEIVFGCYRNDSMVYALNAEDGTLLWKYNTHVVNGEGCNDVAPVIYDVDGDGTLEVIVPSSCNPKTFCFNGATGSVKWVCNTRGSDSPPTIADIDGDGKPEILHGEFGGYVICINAEDGSVNWEIPVDLNSWIQTAPTILDINSDGILDFVVATWNAVNTSANKVYAYQGDTQQLLWSKDLDDVVYHGSAVSDLDNDGVTELLIGCYNDTLYCLESDNGSVKWTYSAGSNFYVGGPAQVADLNHDGSCEVIFTTWYKVIALNHDGTLFWQYDNLNYKQSFRGAAIADINNDIYPDVIFGNDGGHLIALNGNNGTLIFDVNLQSQYGNPQFELDHAPLVADFDQDGSMDVFIVGGHAEYPNFFNDFGRAYLLSVGPANGPDWLMFQNDIWRTSNICNNIMALGEPNSLLAGISFYPNPAHDFIKLELALDKTTRVSWSITDPLGREILAQIPKQFGEGRQTLLIALPVNLTPGMYFCCVWVNSERSVVKLIIE